MRRHTWRFVTKSSVLAGHDWKWRCARCGRSVVVFKSHGSEGKYARPLVDDLGHFGTSGNCDIEIVRGILES